MPLSFAVRAAAAADCIAAYGDPWSLSALTCCPPELLDTVSAPARSVMWTTVLLNDEYMLAIPHRSRRFSEIVGSSLVMTCRSVRPRTAYYLFLILRKWRSRLHADKSTISTAPPTHDRMCNWTSVTWRMALLMTACLSPVGSHSLR